MCVLFYPDSVIKGRHPINTIIGGCCRRSSLCYSIHKSSSESVPVLFTIATTAKNWKKRLLPMFRLY